MRRSMWRVIASAAALSLGGAGAAATEALAQTAVTTPEQETADLGAQIAYGAPPAWADIAEMPAAPSDLDSAIVTRLRDVQSRIYPDRSEHFVRIARQARVADGSTSWARSRCAGTRRTRN